MFDLDAYLERIGLSGRPSLAQVHRAHSISIPFENLDPHGGIPVSLDIDHIQRKLVGERRGGYCFEQNLLLKAGLEALGADVEMLLGRARLGAAAGTLRPRSHLVLRVVAEDAVWHADVGYGLGTLFEPLPFGLEGEYEQAGWRFRVIDEGSEMVLQALIEEQWVDLYGVPPEPVPFVDVEAINWWACTSPRSPFVAGLAIARHAEDGTRTSLRGSSDLQLTQQTLDRSTITAVSWKQVPELLAEHFALQGIAVHDGERLRLAAAAG